MKRKHLGVGVAVVLAIASSFLFTTCAVVGGPRYAAFVQFSFPQLYLTNGGLNFSNFWDPVTGEDVTDATVTERNTTTSASVNMTYKTDPLRGYYLADSNLSHNSGESVALDIVVGDDTLSLSPTVTPDTDIDNNLSPATSATVSRPFMVSWTTTMNSFNASHVWVYVWDPFDADNSYQELVPIGTTSLTIDSSMLQPGNYIISVGAVNRGTIEGASSDSFAIVGSTGFWRSSSDVTVQ